MDYSNHSIGSSIVLKRTFLLWIQATIDQVNKKGGGTVLITQGCMENGTY
ncbi:hypothetical protein ADIARSV_2153 [Arcticibacter svalbardensis MN12-7]|uniref:Uncharacterized protein n=1 Tax=Arcticibacter svalbardensis MN12-7 TaxID=1150600 RepID=R9GSM5_9SPHI|nr:hypothetical protein ADIARSV_2153 [Arcticibacter svalbardensis MN12-7]